MCLGLHSPRMCVAMATLYRQPYCVPCSISMTTVSKPLSSGSDNCQAQQEEQCVALVDDEIVEIPEGNNGVS